MAATVDYSYSHFPDLFPLIKTSQLSYIFCSTVILALVLRIYRSIIIAYNDFLALGPGGTPSTFIGFVRVSYLRLFTIKDPFQPPSLALACYPTSSYLHHLPRRSAPRPIVNGIAPQRQVNQWCSPALHNAIREALHSLAASCPTLLREGKSCFEKHGFALFLSPCPQSTNQSAESDTKSHPTHGHLNPTCLNTGEICHLHATDSSMHVTLHGLDAALVIANGWGERHPLAGCYIHGRRILPPGFVMVYAPRTNNEIPTVVEIVKAAGWWVGGVDLAAEKSKGSR